MSDASQDRAERAAAMLDELAEMGMSLARRLHERAMEAEAPEEAEPLEIADLLADLKRLLIEESASETFLEGPVETLIARLKAELGLAANDAAAEGPEASPIPHLRSG